MRTAKGPEPTMCPDSSVARRSILYHGIPLVYVLLAAVAWPHPLVCGYSDIDIEMYGVIGRMWSRGFLPYASFYDHKPPLPFLLLRFAFDLWGVSSVSVWKLQVVLVTATAIGLFYVLLRRDRPASAIMGSAALLALGIFDAGALMQFLGNTELWSILALVISLALLSQPSRSGFHASTLLSGFGFGLALTAKQQIGPFLLPLLWLACCEGWRLSSARRLSGVVRALALFGLGSALPLALFALYFAWHGALAAAVRAIVVHGQHYARVSELLDLPVVFGRLGALREVWTFVSQPSMLPYTVCAVASLALARPAGRARVSLLLVWLAPALAIVISPEFFPHYLVLVFPPLVFGVLEGGEIFLGPAASGGSHRTVAILFLGTALAFGSPVLAFMRQTHDSPPCQDAQDGPLFELGTAIAARSDADARLLVWDLPPRLYLYSDTIPAIRFFVVFWSFDYEVLCDDLTRGLAQLPAFIAVSNPHTAADRLTTTAEALRGVLRQHYDLLIRNAAGSVFIRRTHPVLHRRERKR